jgi:hypothetical protein
MSPATKTCCASFSAIFERHGVSLSRENVRKKMDELLAEARHQLEAR